MARFVARHIPSGTAALLLVEAALSFGLAYLSTLHGDPTSVSIAVSPAVRQAAVVAVTTGTVSLLLGLYRPQRYLRTRGLLITTALGALVAFPAVLMVTGALGMGAGWPEGADRLWPLTIVAAWAATLIVVRLGFSRALRSRLFVRRVAVASAPGQVSAAVAAMRAGRDLFEVVPGNGPDRSAASMRAAGIRTALVSGADLLAMPAGRRAAFERAGVDLSPEPVFWETYLKRVDIDHLTPAWFEALGCKPTAWLKSAADRAVDMVLSLSLLLFTLPLMLLVALAIRLESPGTVLYRQERVGLGGATFVLLKFRSMRRNAELRGPAWAQLRDPRVTRIGTLIRRTRIDELPQLVNVLRGEMSFIGPRPERPHFVEQLAAAIPHYRERSRVKPGLTGWAQVNYPYGASIEDARCKLSYDLFYVGRRSILLDVAILFATVRVILFQEGAR